jgi:hypothetical protein
MDRSRIASQTSLSDADAEFDLDSLLHPAQAFEHPTQVVHDPDLTLNETRAILASWASDACAVETVPDLRRAPGSPVTVRFDDVIDALRELDRQARDHGDRSAHYRRAVRRQRVAGRRSHFPEGNPGQGPSLN